MRSTWGRRNSITITDAGHAGANVLLTEDPAAAHGWVAKVTDFGLAREADLAARIKTRTYGTVTHMPPELLREGCLSTVTPSNPKL